jgi:hypothetical protein
VVQQALGQAGLTGVDMRDDAQVECCQQTSCPVWEQGMPGGT